MISGASIDRCVRILLTTFYHMHHYTMQLLGRWSRVHYNIIGFSVYPQPESGRSLASQESLGMRLLAIKVIVDNRDSGMHYATARAHNKIVHTVRGG